VQSAKEEFGMMNPMQRQLATSLGGKLRAGEQLTAHERMAAGQMGILQPLLRQHAGEAAEKSGQFGQFVKAWGDEDLQRAQAQVEASQEKITINMAIDEQLIAAKVGERLAGLVKRVDVAIDRVAAVEAKENQFNHVHKINREVVAERR
jgi:tRNA U55 pseudouridine synthase TruB